MGWKERIAIFQRIARTLGELQFGIPMFDAHDTEDAQQIILRQCCPRMRFCEQ